MNLDPIDFFPGYDPYYCFRQQCNRRSTFTNICTHLLAMLLAIGICGGAFYYYENRVSDYQYFKDGITISNIPGSGTMSIEEMKKELEKIKESVEDTYHWRNQLTDLFTKIYVQQESMVAVKINKALDIYDSDKIGMFDYASTYACASIVSTPDTFPYPANKSITFFNLLNVDLLSNPNAILEPANFPGNCFAFYGSTGRIRIKLGTKITIKSVTIDHIKLTETASSAPKDFEVFGLYDPLDVGGIFLGRFSYDIKGRPYQTFVVHPNRTYTPFQYVELSVLNNYGRQEFTCIYRFRVHNMYPTEVPN